MKRNQKTAKAFKAQNEAKRKVLNSLKKKLSSNTLTDEVIADAEALIAEKEAEIDAIEELIEELEDENEDRSAELEKQLEEMTNKVKDIENSIKGPKAFIQVRNFLDSKEGMKAFSEAVKNSPDGSAYRKNIEKLFAENGITPADVMLPPAILDEINDAWEDTASNFLSLLDVTGLVALKVLTETSDGTRTTAEVSRAKGHKKGDEKGEQTLEFDPKEIRAQIVYKYITIDRETVEFEDTTGALMRYVSRELAYRVMHEVMRAVLIGDGRASGSPYKISKIEAIVDASATYQTTVTSAAAVPTIDEIAEAVSAITATGDIILFMSSQTALGLRRYVAATGGTPMYRSLTDLAAELGVSEIRITKLLENPAAGEPSVIAFVGKAYKIVGDITMRGFENFILSYNKYEYLTEVYVGGALSVPNSAAVIVAP